MRSSDPHGRPFARRSVLSGGATVAATALVSGAMDSAWAGDAGDRTGPPTDPEDLGVPMRSVNVRAGAVGIRNGRPVFYVFSNGSPGIFNVIDAETGERLAVHEIVGYESSYAIEIASDGTVFFEARPSGRLFRYFPAEDRVVDLGRVTSGATAITALAIADGIVYGGTRDDAKVFSYDPATDTFTDHGQILAGERFCRVGAVVDGIVYAGVSPTGRFFALELATGTTTEIELPSEYAAGASRTTAIHRSGLLFVFLDAALPCLVYDLANGEWIDEIPRFGLDTGPSRVLGDKVYFEDTMNGDIWLYDPAARVAKQTGFNTGQPNGITRAIGLAQLATDDSAETVVGMDLAGTVWQWTPSTGAQSSVHADVQGSAVRIRRTAAGPDGNLYVGGFFSSGVMARYLVAAQRLEQLDGPTQIEGFGIHDGLLYFGTYPGAGIMRFDPAEPWDFGTNPTNLFSLTAQGQDRPWAIEPIGDRVAIGTLAARGTLDGALTFYTPATGEVDYVGTLFTAHGVVSLAARDSLLAGGTSTRVSGTTPIEDTPRLFLWDAATDELLWEGTPFTDTHTIGDLVFADNGRLWGLTNNGRVFEFDVEARKVVGSVLIAPDLIASGGFPELFFAGDGMLYGTTSTGANGVLFRMRPQTFEPEILEPVDASCASLGPDGKVYYAMHDTSLFRIAVRGKSKK